MALLGGEGSVGKRRRERVRRAVAGRREQWRK
ncbi:hypothetical protein TIFTF001_040125 [Ficus carica]|uniref:Uncharacterized protein n=1 Tax=Ficus carica TaxID=3494 RepID=A0AA87YRW1_FICCA|nr:hypothetical protein TIFTF001_040125 [Ficus carica]